MTAHIMPASVNARYQTLVSAGEIELDSAQARAVDLLTELEGRLREHRLARKSSSLGWLFGALLRGILASGLSRGLRRRVRSR